MNNKIANQRYILRLGSRLFFALTTSNPWHFHWISILLAEALTALMGLILKGSVTFDYLVTGGVVSLIVAGADGSRLSKRHGAVNVLEYRDQGFLPQALLNYLVRLGWSHGDQEIFSREEMIRLFDVADVNEAASRFDPDKLRWLNQQYIINGDRVALAGELRGHMQRRGLEWQGGAPLDKVVDAYRERAVTLDDMVQANWYAFNDFDAIDARAAKQHLKPTIAAPLQQVRAGFAALADWRREAIHDVVTRVATDTGLGFGKIGQPLRVAVTGGTVSPPIDVTLELIGRERVLARLDHALAQMPIS